MAEMTTDQMDEFLSATRQGILLSTRKDGSADGVPVWFDWDGEAVRFFSGSEAPKVARIRSRPTIAMLVTNEIHEPPAWVRFEGTGEIDADADARQLAVDVLAPRYWDLDNPAYAEIVEQWRTAPDDALTVIKLVPDRIRSSGS